MVSFRDEAKMNKINLTTPSVTVVDVAEAGHRENFLLQNLHGVVVVPDWLGKGHTFLFTLLQFFLDQNWFLQNWSLLEGLRHSFDTLELRVRRVVRRYVCLQRRIYLLETCLRKLVKARNTFPWCTLETGLSCRVMRFWWAYFGTVCTHWWSLVWIGYWWMTIEDFCEVTEKAFHDSIAKLQAYSSWELPRFVLAWMSLWSCFEN